MPVSDADAITGTIEAACLQTRCPDEIVIIEDTNRETPPEILLRYPSIKYIKTCPEEFDHGLTRDKALRASTGDIAIFLTSDAVPADEHMIEELLLPFSMDERVAVSYGRHIPKVDAWPFERLVRNFNYPAVSNIRSSEDIPALGIKTFFTSDCCCAYRKSAYEELGGFDYPIKTAEDILFAARAINAGWKVAYTAGARVLHSHNLTLIQQYRRNFMTSFELERHKAYFSNVSAEKEGMKLVKYVSLELLKRGRIFSFIRFGLDCFARLLGNIRGRIACRKHFA